MTKIIIDRPALEAALLAVVNVLPKGYKVLLVADLPGSPNGFIVLGDMALGRATSVISHAMMREIIKSGE